MSTLKRFAETGSNPPSIGRIAPLNMPSDGQRLNVETLMHDLTAANDYDNSVECCHCHQWA
jgi:hypothetical protein